MLSSPSLVSARRPTQSLCHAPPRPSPISLACRFNLTTAGMLHQLEQLLKGALDAHVDVVRKASQGRGIRTLFALKCIAERGRCYSGPGTTLPAMYDDAGWRTLQVMYV